MGPAGVLHFNLVNLVSVLACGPSRMPALSHSCRSLFQQGMLVCDRKYGFRQRSFLRAYLSAGHFSRVVHAFLYPQLDEKDVDRVGRYEPCGQGDNQR